VTDLRVLDAEAVRAALPMPAAIDALDRAFGLGAPEGPLRSHLETPEGSLLVMPAWSEAGLGVKLVTLTPANPRAGLPYLGAVYLFFDAETQQPIGVLDGAELTARRTAAVSGLATRYLARQDARRLVVLGAGVQARTHVEAMRAVRPVEEVVVVPRSVPRAEAWVGELRAGGLAARLGTPQDLGGADLICACTSSAEPVVRGAALAPGVHVNAVGASTPATRELDTEAVRRARVVVESRQAALAEAGDLLIPIAEGAVTAEHVLADLHELVNGTPVRRGEEDVTLFKSVGLGSEDLALAASIFGRDG
jgi:ornithine cyclodeaminase/alanine dehydrogenase-like protein (mu-crystallin family)